MAGANYMGGKRNAARARTKDAVGRAQKEHFGRQRLQVLSQGLNTSRNLGSLQGSRQTLDALSDIGLAHARRDLNIKTDTVPDHFLQPQTPRKSRPVPQPHSISTTRSSKDRPSTVLRMLDTSEPISLRAEMDRLIALPDFASLATRPRPIPITPVQNQPLSSKRRPSPSLERPDGRKRHCRGQPSSSGTSHQNRTEAEIKPLRSRVAGSSSTSGHNYDSPSSVLNYDSVLPPSNSVSCRGGTVGFDPPVAASMQPFQSSDHFQVDEVANEENSILVELDKGTNGEDSGYCESTSRRFLSPLVDRHAPTPLSSPSGFSQVDDSILQYDTTPASSGPSQNASHVSQLSNSSSLGFWRSPSPVRSLAIAPRSRSGSRFGFKNKPLEPTRTFHPSSVISPSHLEPVPPRSFSPVYSSRVSEASSIRSYPDLSVSLQSTRNQFHPSVIGSGEIEHDTTVVGNLFDDVDPWNAIGRILSLDLPASSAGSAGRVELTSTDNRHGVGYDSPRSSQEKLKDNLRREHGNAILRPLKYPPSLRSTSPLPMCSALPFHDQAPRLLLPSPIDPKHSPGKQPAVLTETSSLQNHASSYTPLSPKSRDTMTAEHTSYDFDTPAELQPAVESSIIPSVSVEQGSVAPSLFEGPCLFLDSREDEVED